MSLYYTAPSKEIFDEVKRNATALWLTYDDSYGYATEKVAQIEHVTNVRDNFMYLVAMFDSDNQKKLSSMLSEEACLEIRKRMVDGGMPYEYIPF